MTTSSVTLTRKELYDRVWSTPMRKLAGEFGLSDVGLAKICKKHKIPRPARGYWAKQAAGKRVHRYPLRAIEDEKLDAITILQSPAEAKTEEPKREVHDPFLAEALTAERDSDNRIIVVDSVQLRHPFVRATKEALAQSKPDDYGRVHARWNFERPHFQFGVSPQNVSRALRILQTLVAAWEARGYTVDVSRGHRHGGKDQPVFQIMDQHYAVSFWEPSKRIRDESKASPKPRYSWERDYVYKPTGKLELHVNRDSYWSSTVIRDTAKLRLEDRLNEFICQIYRLVDQAIVKAEQDRIKAIEKAKRKELAIEAEIVRRSDAVRAEQLVQLTQQWEWARKLEVFIAAVREECNQRPDETGVDTEAWLAWAEHYVATVDPLRHDGNLPKYRLSEGEVDELRRQCEADWCEWSERFRTR